MCQQYWHPEPEERRKKLLPFFWTVIARQGSLYGNRDHGSDMNVANFYKISYAGYNEIFTGFADLAFVPNSPVYNRNTNILAFLDMQEAYAGKVAAFSSWNLMPYILNEKENRFPINSGYEMVEEGEDSVAVMINRLQLAGTGKGNTRHDLLTFAGAKTYIEQQHPKVVYIGLGETDEFAHKGRYDQYLQKAHQFDQMMAELWYYVQTDPFYKDNTSFVITTDHGRGRKYNWNKHGFWIKGSGETWLAMMGPSVKSAGEIKTKQQLYQKQIAATVAGLLGKSFHAPHPVARGLVIPTE